MSSFHKDAFYIIAKFINDSNTWHSFVICSKRTSEIGRILKNKKSIEFGIKLRYFDANCKHLNYSSGHSGHKILLDKPSLLECIELHRNRRPSIDWESYEDWDKRINWDILNDGDYIYNEFTGRSYERAMCWKGRIVVLKNIDDIDDIDGDALKVPLCITEYIEDPICFFSSVSLQYDRKSDERGIYSVELSYKKHWKVLSILSDGLTDKVKIDTHNTKDLLFEAQFNEDKIMLFVFSKNRKAVTEIYSISLTSYLKNWI